MSSHYMLEQQDLNNIGQLMDQKLTSMESRMDGKMDEKIEGLAGVVKAGFDRTAEDIEDIKSDLEVVKSGLEVVKTDLEDVKKTVNGIDFKLKRHLEISDDRLFDHQRLHKVYQKWFDQIAEKVGVKLEIPDPYHASSGSQQ